MARQLAYYVHVEDEHGEFHVFGPDDTVPAWAAKKITNRSAWADGDGDDDDSGDEPEAPAYGKQNKGELEDEVARRNEAREDDDKIVVDGNGNKADLVAALEADDAALAGGDD